MATRTSRAAKAGPFACTACGQTAAKWLGRCPGCGGWGTVEEGAAPTAARTGTPGGAPRAAAAPATPVRSIGEVDLETVTSRSTGVGELDRVLGGGLVPGVVALLAGEPGVGKSTLLLEVAARRARAGGTVLYVTGEESAGQVRLRAERTDAVTPHLFLSATADLEEVAAHVEAVDPELLVVDSVQTVGSADIEGTPGGVAQVRAVTSALVALAKQRDLPIVLIGHVTKDGAVAGPRTLEHLVDVVLSFEGERHSTLRMVRGLKNRFGPSDEVGCFEMHDGGIREVTDPSGLFVGGLSTTTAGQAITVAMEGRRPLPAEVQALVTTTSSANSPRRAVSDLDFPRVAKILAVLEQRCGVRLHDRDMFAATVGGMRLSEPAADLAVAVAVASAVADKPVPFGVLVLGEVGLAGELRRVVGTDRRLAEAARLGMRRAIVPPGGATHPPQGMRVEEAGDLHGALFALGLVAGATRSAAGAKKVETVARSRRGDRAGAARPRPDPRRPRGTRLRLASDAGEPPPDPPGT